VLRRDDGTLVGDQFDGAGFVRGIVRKGCRLEGARAIVSGSGGVGSAIAASLAQAGVTELALFDAREGAARALARRLAEHYPALHVSTGANDPQGFDVVVNATPLGMHAGDPLPFDVTRIAAGTMVGEVVMKHEYTPFLEAALARNCKVQVGTDMLFEMIPAYLEFFGYGTATPEALRAVAQIQY
jgi:shikimate dehydrogenase